MDQAHRPRGRGFSPTATIAILVGVTATSVAGFTGLARVMYSQETATATVGPIAQEELATDAESSVPAEAPIAPALAAVEEGSEAEQPAAPNRVRDARPTRPTERPHPSATSPRAGESPSGEAARDDIVRVTDDPLGGVDLGNLAG